MLRELMRGGLQIWAGAIATAAVSGLFNLIIARSLGAAGYGLYTQAILLVPVVAIFGLLSLDTVLTRSLSECEARGRDPAPVLRGAFFAGLSTGLVTTFAYFVAAGFLAWRVLREPGLTPLLQLVAPAALFSVLYWISLGAFRGLKRFRLYAVWQFLPLLLTLVLAVPAVRAAGVQGALLAWLVPQGIFGGAALLLLLKDMKLKETERTGLLLRPGVWLTAAGGVLALLTVLDRTALSHFESSETVGLYGAALLFLIPVNGVATSIRHSMFPYLTESLASGSGAEAQSYFGGAVKYSLILQTFLLIPLAGLGGEFIRLLLPAYGASVGILQAMVYLAFPAALYILIQTSLVAAGETRRLVLPAVASVAAAAVFYLLFVPRWHSVGAVAAAALGFTVAALLFGIGARRYFTFPLREWTALLAPALGLLAALQFATGLTASAWLHLAMTLAVEAAYIAWLFLSRKVGAEEVLFLQEHLQAVGARLRLLPAAGKR